MTHLSILNIYGMGGFYLRTVLCFDDCEEREKGESLIIVIEKL